MTSLCELVVENWVLRMGAVVAALAALWGFIIVFIKYGGRVVRGARAIIEVPANLRKVVEQLAPNGGNTVKDQLNRIEYRMGTTDERMRALMMDSTNGIFESDARGGTININRTYAAMVSMDINGLKGSGWLTAVHHEDRCRAEEEWKSAVEDGREFDSSFRMLNVQAAHAFMVRVRAYPMRVNEKLVGFIGIITKQEPCHG